MKKAIFRFEVADLAPFGGIVLNDFHAVGGTDLGQIFAEGHPSICHDQTLVKPRAAKHIEVGKCNCLSFLHF